MNTIILTILWVFKKILDIYTENVSVPVNNNNTKNFKRIGTLHITNHFHIYLNRAS